MKKLLFLFLLPMVYTTALGQNKYFHELKGMEDSAGVTHLFFKMHDKYQDEYTCGDRMASYDRTDDNIYHFDTSSNSDSVLFEQYDSEHCNHGGGYYHQRIFDYTFYEQNPAKWLKGDIFNSMYTIRDYAGNKITFYLPVPTEKTRKLAHQDYFPQGFFLTTSQDSLFVQTQNNTGTLRFPGNGANWPPFNDFGTYETYTDSVAIPWDIIAQHPAYDSLYFARDKNQHLFRTESGYSHFAEVDTHSFSRDLQFDADSTHIYSLTNSGILVSDDVGVENSWKLISINFSESASAYLSLDGQMPGHLFIADSTNILYSTDYGDSFLPLVSVDDEIAGLYKKPDSNLLYVLTKKELLQLNTETKESTSLKKLAVSNEREPVQIPKNITLEQNYPNPFNPSTVISYKLAGNSLVRLEVFDVTGRKVAVLVDGKRKPAGSHRVSFDGSGLASGIYFYRLQAGGQSLLKVMNFIK